MGYDKNIYHLLCRSFGQCIAISQIVHLDVFDIVAILCVDFSGALAAGGWGFGRGRSCGLEVLTLA